MIEFIFKSTISLSILYLCGVYLIKKSTNYQLNRFLLLGFILFSLLIPLIHISVPVFYSQENTLAQSFNETISATSEIYNPTFTTSKELSGNSLQAISLALVYFIVTFILLVRFLLNLYGQLSRSIKTEKIIYKGIPFRLTNKKISPHSFFRSIFISKGDFIDGKINLPILLHENGHRTQFHTIDILFIELIKVFYWFNPLIYPIKKLIKINHEYLADNYVVRAGVDKVEYSNILIGHTSKNKRLNLVSGFDYSLIKNRILMLSKNNQKKRFAFSYASVFVVVAVLFVLMAFNNSSEIFRRNPTDKCDIDLYRKENKGGFIVNGDTSELFVNSSERDFNYLISKKGSGRMFSSNTRDTAIHRLDNYELKEYQGQIFVDDNYVGSVKKGDFIIVYYAKKVDVYDNERVDIEKMKLEDLQLKMRKQ